MEVLEEVEDSRLVGGVISHGFPQVVFSGV